MPAASPFVRTFLLTNTALSIFTNAAPSPVTPAELELRQHDHATEHDHAIHLMDDVALPSASSKMLARPKTTISPHSSPPSAHGHNHGSHTEPKYILDDVDIHFWHKFPPSYLAADFRLDNNSAIFGEELDETWDPENASGHRGLVLMHALGFYSAYFGLLPIGKFDKPRMWWF